MAFSTGVIGYNGTLNDLSSYRMRGVTRPVIRRKGGPRAEHIKHNDNFENTRRNNAEWKGSIAAAKQVRQAIHPVLHLSDYNYTGSLNALCKKIQQADGVNDWGQRSFLLSKNAHQLAGFSINKFISLEQLLKHPLKLVVQRAIGGVQVMLLELLPGINLANPAKHPQYQFVFSLGAVADMVYNAEWNRYEPVQTNLPYPAVTYTPWQWANKKTEAVTYNLTLNNWHEQEGTSLLFSAGIAFGIPAGPGDVRYVKYSGAAKLVTVF